MKNIGFLLALIYALVAQTAYAQESGHCIRVVDAPHPVTGDLAKSLYNACDRVVFMVWCHEGKGSGGCGDPGQFKKGRKINPGERYFNQFSVPSDVQFHVGACAGEKRRNVTLSASGGYDYSCTAAQQRVSTGDQVICGDREVSYQWRLKHRNESEAFVRLAAEEGVHWVSLPVSEMTAFENGGKVPQIFEARICGTVFEPKSDYRVKADEFLVKLSLEDRHKRQSCLEDLRPDPACAGILRNRNAGSGIRQ